MNESESIKVKRNLTALVEFSRIINSSLDLDFILNNVLLTCMGKFLATRGLIALNINGKLLLRASKGIPEELKNKFPELPVDENLIHNSELKKYFSEGRLQAIEKISSSDDCLGIVCLGEKLNKQPFTEDDSEFLKTILNISSSAIQNSMVVDKLSVVNRFLDSRVQRLNSLFELSKEFGLFSESARVAKLLVYSIIGQFLVSKYAVLTFIDGITTVIESKFPEHRLKELLNSDDFLKLENPLSKHEIGKKYNELFNLGIELIVPMQLQGQTKGLILLSKRINNQEYSESDIEFIYSVGSLAIISIENRRLFKEELAKQKMEEELEIARGIQRNLLPAKIPQYSSFDIAVMNLTSQQVGGDYYDIIRLDDNTFCVAIGDVSGKGVPAALLMANLQAFLKTTCRQGMQLEEATALINDLISENTSDGRFITFFWGILDNEKRSLNYVNAGHNHPLLIRDGVIRKLDKGGIILGVMKTMIPYISENIQLKKDDVILLFTDGITEAKDKFDDEYSDEKLEALAVDSAALSSKEILEKIKTDVQAFARGTAQSDDMTVVVIKAI
ncbi:MAG: PP2C family protein-serine/threonine phosphatase [Ignavibacteriaceae bacterium]|nr:PP2C family protein-serine/threonine phosphatase [Ignavibacteriaceae bacterium]